MRVGNRFEDLENQFEFEAQRAVQLAAKELGAAEKSTIALSERLAQAIGSNLIVTTVGGKSYEGKLARSGKNCLELFSESNRVSIFIPESSQLWIKGRLERSKELKSSEILLDFVAKLEGIQQNRRPVTVHLSSVDVQGTLLSVWRDHIEILQAEGAGSRRERTLIIPATAIEAVVGRW